MTGLTLIVDGELTAICRPLGSRAARTPPRAATRLDMDSFVEPGESDEWWPEGMPSTWRRQELMRVFSAGIPQQARTILEEIARRPDGYPFDALHQTLGMSRLAIAASLGAAADATRAFPGKPALVRRDYHARAYCMPRDVATFLAPPPLSQDDHAD